ncbi:hypothetical protein ACFVWG_21190 [Kribbella sp. NPDC058245]|uniref:hypothetical protein n=1 Tax=Kribbella sp. NPDC058245 TaxID=3346399 RepID=UPI0036EAC426
MRYTRDLELKLRDRLRRLLASRPSQGGHELILVAQWIQDQPALRGVLGEAATVEANVDLTKFIKSMFDNYELRWPTTSEAGRATLIWKLIQRSVADIERGAIDTNDFGHHYSPAIFPSDSLDAAWYAFVEQAIAPLFDYLAEHLADESNMLYILARYVRLVEWFDLDALYACALEDTRQTEAVYDEHLRRFLFSEGIDMPFTQARSASGESDVLAGLHTDDPLVCEIKVFDAADRGKRELATGYHQTFQYTRDYGKSVGYLVIVNLSGRPLNLPTEDESNAWPPFLIESGVRINLISVRARPTPSASKQGKIQPVNISVDDLRKPDIAD